MKDECETKHSREHIFGSVLSNNNCARGERERERERKRERERESQLLAEATWCITKVYTWAIAAKWSLPSPSALGSLVCKRIWVRTDGTMAVSSMEALPEGFANRFHFVVSKPRLTYTRFEYSDLQAWFRKPGIARAQLNAKPGLAVLGVVGICP